MQKIGTAGPEIVIEVVVAEGNTIEQHVHVRGGIDRDPAVPNLAERPRIVGIAAHERGHVEGNRQPAGALGEDHLVALVGLLRVPEPGELPDRPRLAPVARRVIPRVNGYSPGQPIRSNRSSAPVGP